MLCLRMKMFGGEAFYKGEERVFEIFRASPDLLLLNNPFSRFFVSGMDGPIFLAMCIAILRCIR